MCSGVRRDVWSPVEAHHQWKLNPYGSRCFDQALTAGGKKPIPDSSAKKLCYKVKVNWDKCRGI